MAGNFDDIIRQVLQMQPRQPDASQPFNNSELGPMIEDFLNQSVQRYAPTAEGQMPPPDKWREMTERFLGPSQQLPFVPDGSKPQLLPNITSDDTDLNPHRPLQRGNAKRGTGIDV